MKCIASAIRLAAVCGLVLGVAAQGAQEMEPNGWSGNASTHVVGQQSYGWLTPGDEDWFRVVLTAPGDVRAWTGPGRVGQAGNTRLALFDHTATLVLEVDDGSVATHGQYSLLEAGPLVPGTFYLRVRGFDAATTGSYTLAFPPAMTAPVRSRLAHA